MGMFADILNSESAQAAQAPAQETLPTSLRRGFDSGMLGAGSQLQSLAGGVGEAAGFDDFARNRNADAADLQAQAQEAAPQVQSYKQVKGMRSGANYVAGLLGGSAPIIGAGLAGGLVTGGAGAIPAALGAAAATAPFEIGDVLQKQQADPEAMKQSAGMRLRDAALAGGASAALQGIVPGMVTGKLLGHGAEALVGRSLKTMVGHAALDVPLEGLTEGGGEAVKQYGANQDKPLDWDAITENAIGGAAAGGALGGAGLAGDVLHSNVGAIKNVANNARTAVSGAVNGGKDALGGVADRVGGAVSSAQGAAGDAANAVGLAGAIKADSFAPDIAAGRKKVASIWDDLGGYVQKGRAKLDDTVDRIANSQPLGDIDQLSSAAGEHLRNLVNLSDNETAQKAKTWATEMANDAGLTPERRQAAAEALQNIGNQGGAAAVAAMKKTYDAGKSIADKITAFAQVAGAGLKHGAEEVKGKTINERAAKRSDDDSGFRKVFRENIIPEVMPILKDTPGLFDRTEDVNRMGDALRAVGEKLTKGSLDSDTIAKAIDAFGGKTVDVLSAVHNVMGKLTSTMGQAETESFFKNLNEIDAIQKRTSGLHDTISQSLTDDAKQSTLASDIPGLTRLLVAHARGELGARGGERSAQDNLTNTRMADMMKEHFGPKADFVSKAVEEEAGQTHGVDEPSGLDTQPEATDVIRKGRGPNNDPVMHPDLFKNNNEPGQNYAAQYMKDMQAKYPDHDVRFEYAEGSKTHGHVVAEKAADPTSFSEADMDALKHDTKKFPNSPSRLKVGDMNIDAVKVAKVMRSKGQADWEGPDNTTNKQNLVDAFKRGIAQLTEHAGEVINVPDAAVIGFTGGKALTWGEAKTLDPRNSADKERDGKLQLLQELKRRIDQATMSDEVLAKQGLRRVEMPYKDLADEQREYNDLRNELEYDRDNELAKGDDVQGRGRAKPVPLTVAEGRPASAVRTPGEAVGASRADNGEESSHATQEADKGGQIHEAASRLKDDDLINRSNMVGERHHVSDRVSEQRNALVSTVHEWGQVKSGPARKIAARAKVLLGSYDSMGKADRRAFQLLAGKSPAEASSVVNDLARKYKDVIVASGVKVEPHSSVVQYEAKKAGAASLPKPAEPGTSIMAKAIAKRMDYLVNPPEDYSTAVAGGHVAWAEQQLERVRAEAKKAEGDRVVDLDELATDLKVLIQKGKKVLEGDESLKDFEGSPDPKVLAAKKAALLQAASSSNPALLKELTTSTDAKGLQRAVEVLPPGKASDAANARLAELVQNPDTALGLQTKKYSLESADAQGANDGRARLITRLAADRRDAFVHAPKDGVFQSSGGADTFGPLGREYTHYFAHDAGTTHSFIIPNELVPRLSRELAAREGSTGKQVDALSFFSVQHAFYDTKTGDLETFGPRPDAPGGKLLDKLGALGDTGQKFAEGVPVTRVEGVTGRDTAKFLASVLAYSKHVLGRETLDVNWERATGANEGKQGGGRYSAQTTSAGTRQTISSRADVEAHIEQVLGKSIQTKWAALTHAGEFERMRMNDVIRLSVHALDPMSVAHHESLHAFFAQLKDAGATDITQVLERAAASPHALAQLQEAFKGEPGVLAQLKDPEERAAYMYQLWAAGKLQVGPQVKGVFGKIANFIRSTLGIWTNDQRALHIMEYFHSGKYAQNLGAPSAVRRHLMEAGHNQVLDTARSFAEPLVKLADAVVGTGGARLRDTGIPSLNTLADLIKRDALKEGGDQGFIQAARVEGTKRRGALGEALAGFTPEQLNDAMEGLQRGQKPGSGEAQAAAAAIKGFLAETKAYMGKAGVDIGDLGPDYFPRVWDTHYISKHQQDFMDMLEPYVRSGQFKGNPKDFIAQLGARDGAEFGIETRTPGMQFKKERKLAFIKPDDAAMFVSKDLFGTLNSYINQATRRAEWNRRLGDGQLESLFEKAKAEGATPENLALADQYLKGIDGTLGDNLNPHARRIMGNMIVYQNVRLLPMAMFSMIIDPMGVMVRGGTMGEAWSTFKRGMAAIPESFGKAAKHDEASRLAEMVGVVDNAALAATMGDVYTQGMVGGTAQKINNAFFKFNMVEGLNRSFRIGASEAAMSFMGRHADGSASVHSKRWMAELGLRAGDIKTAPAGRIALTEYEGLSPEQTQRVHAAINQWVDGAMLRPDAADKPIWMNDPHYALISHLKQFVFAFQKVIIGRVVHEIEHGNYTPAMALASYVPIMMAADFAKGMIMGGGDQPEWKKGWGMEDYLGSGIQRAGLLGVGQFGFDVAQNVHRGGVGIGALAGPTLEQFADSVQLLGGHKQFGPFVLDALPANALYKESLGGESKADPMFAD